MDDAQLGRMIVRLQSYKTHGYNFYDYAKYKYIPGKRIWTDKQIMESLGLSKARFDACRDAWKYHPPRKLTTEEWRNNYFTFWDREKRWHTRKDRVNWRETKLHSTAMWDENQFVERYCASRTRMLRAHPEMVFTCPNLTLRRNLITRLGGADKLVQTLIKKGKAELIQQDDFGTLWKLNFRDGADSHMMYVEVVNSSPQLDKDGKVKMKGGKPIYDHYFLRVPPSTRTARAAVAWTFDKVGTSRFAFAAQS